MVSQLKGGDTSQGSSHHPQVFSEISSGKVLSHLFKNIMGILSEIGEGGDATADSVTPVIGHNQVQSLFVIKERDLIIIADHLTIPMEK
jgi:outer membrane receptor for monomeric catechols